jgi:hypothetical protein
LKTNHCFATAPGPSSVDSVISGNERIVAIASNAADAPYPSAVTAGGRGPCCYDTGWIWIIYIEGGPNGPMVIAVTESNKVYSLDAVDGSIIWWRKVGEPVLLKDLPCPPKLETMGITGTPVIDLASRALFLDAMTTPDGGNTKQHLIISLDVDTGDTKPGWPVDVEATANYNGLTFAARIQQQRPALAIVNNIFYVGYGSMQDCDNWHGWLVGVPIAAATAALRSDVPVHW